jgi:flagellar FliJ protein
MKKFSFNLESVLVHRKLLEDNERQRMLKIHFAILQAQQLRDNLRNESAEYRRLLGKQGEGTVDIDHIRHLTVYLEKLDQDMIQISHILSKLEEDKRLQVEKLLQAKKKREMVEKLKEKKHSAHIKEAMDMEQKLLDELSVAQYELRDEQNLPTEKSNSSLEASKCRK